MSDSRSHRGLHPQDAELFSPQTRSVLLRATSDLSWLLSRGYAIPSARDLVGNRYGLVARQRIAVARCACSDEAAEGRRHRQVPLAEIRGCEVWIDGLNLITGLEVALSGGVILVGRDGCCRDVAGVHRNYRKVEETWPALERMRQMHERCQPAILHWWLDQPVSNSGRLKRQIEDAGQRAGLDWRVDLHFNPDRVLSETQHLVVTSDSVILDRCQKWVNLVAEMLPGLPARVLDLSSDLRCSST